MTSENVNSSMCCIFSMAFSQCVLRLGYFLSGATAVVSATMPPRSPRGRVWETHRHLQLLLCSAICRCYPGRICQPRRQGQLLGPVGECYQGHNHILLYSGGWGNFSQFSPSGFLKWLLDCYFYLSNNSSPGKVLKGNYIKLQAWYSLLKSFISFAYIWIQLIQWEKRHMLHLSAEKQLKVSSVLRSEFNNSIFK